MVFLHRAVSLLTPLVVATTATGSGFLPPWWVLHKVKPEGKPRDMGGWTAVTFSEEQQAKFAVSEDGEVADQEKSDAALQAFDEEGAEATARRLMLPPWWVLHKVKPEGKPKDMGGWTAVTFSEEQQAEFAVSEDGEVADQEKFDAALQAVDEKGAEAKERRLMLPPWWVLHKVKPEGTPKDMGGWIAATFSEAQQAKFAVDELGQAADQEKFDAALQALDEKKAVAMEQLSFRRLMEKPWWLIYDVKPAGEPKNMGGWTSATFSEEQQERFAVNEDGVILDEDKHHAALRALADEQKAPPRKLYV